jgi:citrate lyase subunit beta/citryl-CoA lyase
MGDNVRSDCFVEISANAGKKNTIALMSKVEALYGRSIRLLVQDVLTFFGITGAIVALQDYGAVPFVIAARLEAALKRAIPGLNGNFQLNALKKKHAPRIDRLRRTRLYLPGNLPHLFLNAGLHVPDCLILDLEDSVPPSEKDAARILVRNALLHIDFGTSERMVRINQLPAGFDDLQQVIPAYVETVLIPKCESADTILAVEKEIIRLKTMHGMKQPMFLLPIIESALGIVHAFEIASSSKNICGVAIGLEDYTADIGAERTKGGIESFYARSAVVNAAKAAGVMALDSVFSDLNDDDGLKQSVLEAKGLGFEGKGCIHPRQIKIIHEAFAPSEKEIDYAQRVVQAFEEAETNGSGVVALGSKMIDPPVVKRAQRLLALHNKS